MKKEMLINVLQPEESRIAIVEDGVLEELYVERNSLENYVGNIYKGRVVNIEPSIQAAFIDFGVGRNGFLHVSDVEYQYYRHLVAGPYWIYRAHRDKPSRVLAVLAGSVDQPGDIAEQLASRQEIVTNKAAMELATLLYIDQETQRPKKGAAGRGPGSARRFADILNQFDLMWDLYAMQIAAMLKMMPKEFYRFI